MNFDFRSQLEPMRLGLRGRPRSGMILALYSCTESNSTPVTSAALWYHQTVHLAKGTSLTC